MQVAELLERLLEEPASPHGNHQQNLVRALCIISLFSGARATEIDQLMFVAKEETAGSIDEAKPREDNVWVPEHRFDGPEDA